MKVANKSISKIIREFISMHPFIKECLVLNIVNFSALARYLTNELRRCGLEVSFDAVKMALIRLRSELCEEKTRLEERVRSILANSVIELQTDLIVLTAKKMFVIPKLNELARIMENARFFHIIQGTNNFTIIATSEFKDDVINLIGRDGILDFIEGQTAITLISPMDIITTPGFIAYITSILASNGINITQIVSCYKDTILIINRSDALKAYQILEELILSLRSVV